MSKEQFYDPQQIFSETDIHFEDIPVFAYKKTAKEQFESGRFTKEDLLTIWRDMRYIREFENRIKSLINFLLGKSYHHTIEINVINSVVLHVKAGTKFQQG